MRLTRSYLLLIVLVMPVVSFTQLTKGFAIKENAAARQVEIWYDQQMLTAYCYFDSSRKPVLFPVKTIDGTVVTRSYPFQMIPGERTDHPHHTGAWLNYESVNGLDFWNNSTAIPVERRSHYGTIHHQSVVDKKVTKDGATLVTTATWVRPDQKVLLKEKSEFRFLVSGTSFVIDRITTLTATDTVVTFKDVKDGLFAIRVARELELPSREKSGYIKADSSIGTEPLAAVATSGNYFNSEGRTGDSVWGKVARWVVLSGKKDGKEISIAIIDHPSNKGYPAYWHARGYGLFAVNPLGRKIFSQGKEELNLSLQPGESVTFRYRLVIHSGPPPGIEAMNRHADIFSKTK